jgi:periplasmic protein TonB
MLIHRVKPDYPATAKAAHIHGTVVLRVIVGKDGAVQQTEYTSGPPDLKDAAIAAVNQWRYKPVLLNNRAVEVETVVSVTFGKP